MSSVTYVEDQTLVIPVLKDGVTRLGDLWDCNESKYVGENLFNQNLDGKYINPSPIESFDYQLIHSKSSSDQIKLVNVGGEVSLELLAGLITVKGSAEYKSDKKDNTRREQLICHYKRETYSVEALPNSIDIQNEFVVKKLMKKELKATHFVRGVILGADVKADILVTQNDSSNKNDIKGDVFGKLVYGPVNASVKVKLGFFDSEDNKDYNKEINVHSMPYIKSEPKTVEEMFKMIESVDAIVEKQKHFPGSGDKVVGVPIRFVLVPIKKFFDVKIEKLYLKLSDKVLNNFNEMLVKVQDIQVSGYIMRKVLNDNKSLSTLLNDSQSKLSLSINQYEKDLRNIGIKFFEESIKTLKLYKDRKASVENLLEIQNRFEIECNSSNELEKIAEFVRQGETDLRSFSSVDIKDSMSYIKILSNNNSLSQFIIGDKENKMWLETDIKAPVGVFLRLDEMVESLSKQDFKVGVAVKSISEKFRLSVKARGEVFSSDKAEEIPFILGIIAATVGVGIKNELLFFSMNAEMINTKLPVEGKEEMSDIINLIRKLKIPNNITISRSRLDTLDLLTRNDNKWKFFMPIDAKQTSFQAIRNLQNLTTNFKDVDWIVGNLDIPQMSATGYLFIVRNSVVFAVCLDDYDLILLRDKCYDLTENGLKFFSPQNMKYSFYPERAQSSEIIIKVIELHSHKNLGINEYGLKSFDEEINEKLMNTLELACALHTKNETDFISTLAKFALEENQELTPVLSRAGFSITDLKFYNKILSEDTKKSIAESIHGIITKTSPISTKINIAIQVINEVIDSPEDDIQEYESKLDQVINAIIADENCVQELKNNIEVYNYMDLKLRCVRIKSELENFANREDIIETLFHSKMLHSVLINKNNLHFCDILKRYINKIQINDNIFKSVKTKFLEELGKKYFNQLIASLAECSHGVKYYILHKGLELYSGSLDSTAASSILKQFSDNTLFNENHWRDLWKNNRFQQIIRSSSDDLKVLGTLFQMGCQSRVPDYIPEDIAQKLNKLREDETDIELPEEIKNFDECIELLREMRRKSKIPKNFKSVLTKTIENNKELFEKLENLKILKLFKWDYEDLVFPEAIELDRIVSAVDIVDKLEKNFNNNNDEAIDVNDFNFEEKITKMTDKNVQNSEKRSSVDIEIPKFNAEIHEKLIAVFGDSKKFIDSKEFVRLSSIIEKPNFKSTELSSSVAKAMPYIIQRIKMWGCQALTADNISSLISSEENTDKKIKVINLPTNKPRFGKKTTSSSTQLSENDDKQIKIPLSRLDIIVGVINSVEAVVAQDLLNIIAKFPLALPLIIKELHDQHSFMNLMPWLTQPVIKWESSPGKIIENHLFVDKFKMIATVRIGDTEKGKSGKTTIINQILSTKNMFSCCGEPGAKRGKPLTLEGTVEFVWLTQETASPKLWESVLQKHYKKEFNELILLANLHGNALNFENNLKILGQIASSFIVFMMPKNNENSKENWDRMAQILGIDSESDRLSCVAIDPPLDNEDFDEHLVIDTSKIADDSNIEKLRNVLKSTLELDGKQIDFRTLEKQGEIKIAEIIETKESRNLIEFVKKETCEIVKQNMTLQKGNKTHEQCFKIWTKNEKLKKLIELMRNVLLLETQSRIKAMAHLEKELGRLSAQESANARQEFLDALDQLQKTIGAKSKDQVIVLQWKLQVTKALEKMDNISLGLEHFFREIGKIYEIILANNPNMNPFATLAKSYAELLIAGQAIELLDGDSGSITGPWLTAICNCVYQQIPQMKVFVISILGLQSSGKSTLLNAMFACKFAVSVGRCTRGLFMRLLFLDETMKKKLNFDAILLIDTEGLGAPEKQNEADAERKDRLMATFAMGVSHLTIVNVLGEYMRDLTEILQIAIVAMARLEKADISPDILMVQHLTERNTEKISSASKQFGEALEKAINISDEKDVNLGVRNSKCLNTLRQTIALGKLFRQFRPFKNGASVYSPPSEEYHQDVVDLYNSIIGIAQESKFRADFKQWQILVQSYWDSIKSENFMRFKDVKDLQEFLQRGDIISRVKESIESSFREHSEILRGFLSEQAKRMNEKIVTRESIIIELKDKLKDIPNICPSQPSCNRCNQVFNNQTELYAFVEKKPSEHETRLTIHNFIKKTREWYFKELSQMLSAIAFGQIKSSENLEKIEKRLREVLKTKREFTENDIQSIAGTIWRDIEIEAADKVTKVSVIDQIEREISSEYNDGPKFIKEFKGNVIQTLKNIPAVHKTIYQKGKAIITRESDVLEMTQVYELEGQLAEISEIILNEENSQNFQTGMVAKVKRKVEQIIQLFEDINKLKLKSEFKWKLHAFANQKFRIKMKIKQNEWDQKHNPLFILRKNKSQYMDVIFERLKYGFNYDSDGMIAGNCLLNAIKQKAIKAGNRQRIDDVLGIGWLTNSEIVRLKYFSELVEGIKNKNLRPALNHFDDPKNCIEFWFTKQVNSFSTGKELDKFSETFRAEIERVIQDVRNSSSITKTRAYIEEYISSCDGINFPPGLDSNKANETEIGIFKNRLIEVLNDNKKQMNITSETYFMNPSDNKQVIDRLGCTHACPLCSALCWGQRGHDEDSGETRKHHTCHQPMGLSGTKYKESNELISDSCHDQRHVGSWWIDEKNMSWDSMRKLDKYKNWRYEIHVNNKFNDLMNWFYFNLHESIARDKGLEPGKSEHLSVYGMYNLDVGSIMAAINDKI